MRECDGVTLCGYVYVVVMCKSRSTAVRFELTRVTPIDFESIALTARPSCQSDHLLTHKQTSYAPTTNTLTTNKHKRKQHTQTTNTPRNRTPNIHTHTSHHKQHKTMQQCTERRRQQHLTTLHTHETHDIKCTQTVPHHTHTIDSSLSISCLLHTTSIAYATSNHCVSPSRHASSSRARIPVPIVLPPLPPCIMYSRSEAGSCVSRFETTVSCASFASRLYCSWAVNQCHLMYPIG